MHGQQVPGDARQFGVEVADQRFRRLRPDDALAVAPPQAGNVREIGRAGLERLDGLADGDRPLEVADEIDGLLAHGPFRQGGGMGAKHHDRQLGADGLDLARDPPGRPHVLGRGRGLLAVDHQDHQARAVFLRRHSRHFLGTGPQGGGVVDRRDDIEAPDVVRIKPGENRRLDAAEFVAEVLVDLFAIARIYEQDINSLRHHDTPYLAWMPSDAPKRTESPSSLVRWADGMMRGRLTPAGPEAFQGTNDRCAQALFSGGSGPASQDRRAGRH